MNDPTVELVKPPEWMLKWKESILTYLNEADFSDHSTLVTDCIGIALEKSGNNQNAKAIFKGKRSSHTRHFPERSGERFNVFIKQEIRDCMHCLLASPGLK